MTSTRSALTVLTVAVLALAACGRDSSTSVTSGPTSSNRGAESSTPATTLTSGGGSTEATAATLTISGRAFGSVAVKAGMPITIVNEDAFRHTVTHRIPGDSDGESPEMASLVASFVDGAVSFRAIPAVEASRNVDAVLVLKWRTIRRVIFEARRKGTITLAPGDLDRADGSAELLNALRTVALLPAVARVLAARVE
jgi:hypothetical protein